ncbi:hypothetical protein MHTCC0001_19350 [Flavobacteriaceae bacterium MHTCC 0001]
MEDKVDKLVSAMYKANEPGAAILIAKDGKPIYRKAFGKANLELDAAMQPNNVFQIGSITKQFTAVAILMLEEQGKLNIDDTITKYIPNYPTQGQNITIHHLLNHTSGIKSYTSMPTFRLKARTDMTPETLINVFKNEPMDFAPGDEYRYNNSGYILLGYIIEKVSGQSYAEFIEQHIFKKLGMSASLYGSNKKLIKQRASGYQKTGDTYVNANYISLTLPYAAGSLMSTVDDLLIWQNAIVTNTLISKESLNRAINGSTLNNGEKINYGYGWSKNQINGSTTYQHGGGIFGYTSMGIYLPEEKIFVSGLTNCNCKNISGLVTKIAAIAINKPFPSVKDKITLTETQKKRWTGAYQFNNNTIRHITLENGQLYSQKEGQKKYEIFPMSEHTFIFWDGLTSLKFSLNNTKKQLVLKSTHGKEIGKEINKPEPKAKKEIAVPVDILKKYIGKYQLAPNFIITIELKNNQLFAQATAQPQFQIFAEDEDTFFLKVVEASIDFNKDDNGNLTSLTLHQSGQHMEGKKIE